jgi:MFS family permease
MGRRALVLAGTGSFLSAAGASLMGIALPSLARAFGVSLESAQGLMLAYTITVTVCLLPFGLVADRVGLVKIARVGFSAFAIASAALVVVPSFRAMMIARSVQGASAALLMASLPAWLSAVTPPNERGRALGLSASATYVGLTTGPVLGGFLVRALGPQGIFVVLVPIAAVSAIALFRTPVAAGASGASGTPSRAAGLRELFGTQGVRGGAFAAYLQYATTFAVSAQIPFLLQDEHGMSPERAGLVAVVQPAVMVVVAPFAGRLSDARGARPFVVVGSLVCALAAFAMRATLGLGSPVVVGLCLGVLGLGAGLFTSPNNASLLSAAPPKLRGSASALVALARNAGMVTGVVSSTRVLTWVSGTARPRGDAFVSGYRAALLVACALGVGAALVSLGRAKPATDAT